MKSTHVKLVLIRLGISIILIYGLYQIIGNQVDVSIKYQTSQDGIMQLYYSNKNDSLSEQNSMRVNINGAIDNQIVSFEVNKDNIDKLRIDFEKIDNIKINEVKIKYLGVDIKSYTSNDILEEFTMINNLHIELEEETVDIVVTGNDPFIGLSRVNSSRIVSIQMFIVLILSIIGQYFIVRTMHIDLIKSRHILIVLILGLLIIPSFVYRLIDTSADQNFENKTLSKKPQLRLNTLEEYPEKFEQYYNDHIPFKEGLVKTNSWIKYYLLNKSPVERVIKGQDEWLYYTPTLDDYIKNNLHTDEELEYVLKRLKEIEQQLDEQGIEFYIMVAPNKNTIYPEYMPLYYEPLSGLSRSEQLIEYLQLNSDINIIYPKQQLLEYKDAYQLYYKWDTHWNEQGGYVGFKALADELGIEAVDKITDINFEKHPRMLGDLAHMMGVVPRGEDTSYLVNYMPHIQVTVVEEIDQKRHHYTSTSSNDEKILVFRDSFGTAMAPYISKSFSESVFLWKGFNIEDVEKERPDVVVYELVERNSYNFKN